MATPQPIHPLKNWYQQKAVPELEKHYTRHDYVLNDLGGTAEQNHQGFKQGFLERVEQDRVSHLLELLKEDGVQKTEIRKAILASLEDLSVDIHFKGLVGECLLDWVGEAYRSESLRSALKTGSSTEPGKDMIEIVNKNDPDRVQLYIWEAKSGPDYPSHFGAKLKTFFSSRAVQVTDGELQRWWKERVISKDVYYRLRKGLFTNGLSKQVFYGAFIACDDTKITNRANSFFPVHIEISQRTVSLFGLRAYDDTLKEWKEHLCKVKDRVITETE